MPAGMSHQEEAPGRPRTTVEKVDLLMGLGKPRCSTGKARAGDRGGGGLGFLGCSSYGSAGPVQS